MVHFSIKYCLLAFSFVGGHPQEGYGIRQVILHLMSTLFNGSLIFLAILLVTSNPTNWLDKDTLKAYSCCFVCAHGILKNTAIFLKKSAIQDLVQKMDKRFWKIEDITNSEDKKEYHKSLLYLEKQLKFFFGVAVTSMIPRFSFAFALPNEYSLFECYRPPGMSLRMLSFYQMIVLIDGLFFPICSLDIFIMSLLILLKLQFTLVRREMKRIFDNDTGDKRQILNRLKKCIDHHNFLLDYGKRLNNAFSFPTLIYLVIIILSMCFEMYLDMVLKSPATVIASVVYAFAATYIFCICYCLPAQSLTDEAYEILKDIYSSDWYNHPQEAAAVLLVMKRSQKELFITAGGFINLNLETCLETVKTMVSYSMFLRTMGMK